MKKHCATETGKRLKTSKVLAGEAHRNGKTSTAKHLRREIPFAYSWALNKAEFCTSLTLKLSGARFCASDLNAKLDLGDETEECHGLAASASHERLIRVRPRVFSSTSGFQ